MRQWALAIAVSLITLEAVLQIGAVVMAWAIPEPVAAAEGKPHVLCIGDSFTFGIGATAPDRNYPGVLQSKLAEHGFYIRVVNAGRPGHDTRDGILKTRDLITPSTRVVCVLLGTNDACWRPKRLSLDELDAADVVPGSAFTWKWRTGQLLAIALRFPFRSWLETEQTKTPESPASDHQDKQAAGFALLLQYGLEHGLIPQQSEPTFSPPNDREVREALRGFWDLERSGEIRTLLTKARATAAAHPTSAYALAMLVKAEMTAGHNPQETLSKLQTLNGQPPDAASKEWLIWATQQAGHRDKAIELAKARIREEPQSLMAWRTLQRQTYQQGDWELFREAAAKTLVLLGQTQPANSARILRRLAKSHQKTPERFAMLLAIAQLLDGETIATRHLMQQLRGVPRASVEAVLAQVEPLGVSVDKEFGPILDEVYAEKQDDEWLAVVRDNLVSLGQVARRSGAEVVVLSYPTGNARASQREAARMLGARWAPVKARFDEELETRTRSELFVPDGHCSDAGYELIAEVVSEHVLELLRK